MEGVWSLLLAIPMVGIVKVVFQYIEDLQPPDQSLKE